MTESRTRLRPGLNTSFHRVPTTTGGVMRGSRSSVRTTAPARVARSSATAIATPSTTLTTATTTAYATVRANDATTSASARIVSRFAVPTHSWNGLPSVESVKAAARMKTSGYAPSTTIDRMVGAVSSRAVRDRDGPPARRGPAPHDC